MTGSHPHNSTPAISGWAIREQVDRRDSQRRRELLKAGRKIFERLGFGAATIEDIAREAGVGRSTFYVYFASKTDIFAVLAEQVRDAFTQAQHIDDSNSTDIHAVLEATIGSTLDVTVENLALMTVLDHQALADDHIKALWSGIRQQTIVRTARYLQYAAERGLADLAAQAQTLAMMGAGMNEMFAPRVADNVIGRDEAIAEMLAVFTRVIERRPG